MATIITNLVKDFFERLRIDYQEYRNYKIAEHNIKRDRKMIERALSRARMKNDTDGKTYWIMKDLYGGINELTREQLNYFARKGVFPKKEYTILDRLNDSLAVVTSNKPLLEQYSQVQLKKEQDKTKTDKHHE